MAAVGGSGGNVKDERADGECSNGERLNEERANDVRSRSRSTARRHRAPSRGSSLAGVRINI
ncbi:MAG: hypothetical protein E6614_20120 [Bradyrhizobium sp.]|jgi:hypothetical protein|uniref:hypothetical protein n=1 Tax=Bradyrhizobium sp. TaxID=376 RepID=UPI0006741405|nr:hypothetical protein [Bradyrhizobium sp.]MDU1670248.1 hypothetical protein [Bradyrhizobium sp.]MDU1689323.1 hypothetical protein [Bradyrhizobium sp.]MDU2923119.1 hypothetical protein [Bradyrhizobium sp.]MDU3043409.1 hypothetical protein [Bradyrhizobium sp.]MDU3126596.1 hypothetical protein [Bradyrhizobium sp.]